MSVKGKQSHTLTSEGADASEDGTGRGTPVISIASLAVAGDFSSSVDVAQTIRAANGQPGVISLDMRNAARESGAGVGTQGDGIREDGVSYGVSAHQRNIPGVATETIVRRLTPLECERLQGFPDDWTDGQSDAQRYREMGNSLAVPVVEWIARRVIAVDEQLNASEVVS